MHNVKLENVVLDTKLSNNINKVGTTSHGHEAIVMESWHGIILYVKGLET